MELLEEAGLPPVCAALAVEDDADKQLGTVLAEAVQVGNPEGTLQSINARGNRCQAPATPDNFHQQKY